MLSEVLKTSEGGKQEVSTAAEYEKHKQMRGAGN